jgi:hypothetical protein
MLPEYKISEHLHNGTFSDSFDPFSVAVHILTPECNSMEDYELRHECIERVVQMWRDADEDLARLSAAYDVNVTVLAGGISEVLVRWSPTAVYGLESAVRARVVQWAAEKLEVWGERTRGEKREERREKREERRERREEREREKREKRRRRGLFPRSITL